MATLTVGVVAAIINLVLFIVSLLGTTFLAFVLAGLITNQETAGSWNIIGRSLQNTYWPELTRADSSRTTGVRWPILVASTAAPVFAALVAVASVVTPIGLDDTLKLGSLKSAQFTYAADPSSYGTSTSPRGQTNFSRICDYYLEGTLLGAPAPCPYSDTYVVVTQNSTTDVTHFDYPWGINITLSNIVKDIFSSGTRSQHSTVSNFFDIEWRQLSTDQDEHYQNGSRYVVGSYRQIEMLIQDEEVMVVEGLVVDAKDGGIGFRNHTLPDDVGSGAVWQEDLLFIQPETVCVALNMSIDFDVPTNFSDSLNTTEPITTYLTDQGGLLHLPHNRPEWDRTNSQSNPDLRGRATRAAWENNAMTAFFYDLAKPGYSPYPTNDTSPFNKTFIGKRFPLLSTGTLVPKNGLGASQGYAHYIAGLTSMITDFAFSNPYNISQQNLTVIGMSCSGQDATDIANMTNIFVICGLLRGAPQRIDPGHPLVWEAGSRWSSPLYSCASAVKASIKDVSFRLNGTDGLRSLTVDKVENMAYKDTSMAPLWGMEDTGLRVPAISPIWGLVSPDYEGYPNLSTIRKPEFFLPGYTGGGLQMDGFRDSSTFIAMENLPAAHFFRSALGGTYGGWTYSESTPGIETTLAQLDYSGHSSVALFQRWQNLSKSEAGMASIINLIWTDLAAPAVVGTKGTLGPGNAGAKAEIVAMTVRPFVRGVTYDWRYAIPALILAALLLLLFLVGLVFSILRKSSFSIIRQRLQETSPGRIYTAFLYPDRVKIGMHSRNWARLHASTQIAPGAMDYRGGESSGLVVDGVAANDHDVLEQGDDGALSTNADARADDGDADASGPDGHGDEEVPQAALERPRPVD